MTVRCKPCPMCGKGSTVEVSEEGFNKWRKGELIQNAFPELKSDERELLITGTHSECWDKLFASF